MSPIDAPRPHNDVTRFLLAHDVMRALVPEATRQVRALRHGDRVAAGALRRWWGAFTRVVHDHHHGEEDFLVPVVAVTAPELAAEVAGLEQEHASLEALLADAGVGIARLGRIDDPAAFATVRADVAAGLDAFDGHLRTHLGREEELVLAVLRERVPPIAFARMERQRLGTSPIADVTVVLPMVMTYADAGQRAVVLDGLSVPVRLLYRLWFAPAYDRLRAALPLVRVRQAGTAGPARAFGASVGRPVRWVAEACGRRRDARASYGVARSFGARRR